MKKFFLILFLAMLLIGLSPLILAFSGLGLASAFGCAAGASGAACVVLGTDIGPMLEVMMMMHWLGIIGLPLAALGGLGLLVTGLVHIISRLAR